eukprot:2513607-Prymnesium_polylepis.1
MPTVDDAAFDTICGGICGAMTRAAPARLAKRIAGWRGEGVAGWMENAFDAMAVVAQEPRAVAIPEWAGVNFSSLLTPGCGHDWRREERSAQQHLVVCDAAQKKDTTRDECAQLKIRTPRPRVRMAFSNGGGSMGYEQRRGSCAAR